MKIDSSEFCSIAIKGKTYSNDVLVRMSGEGAQRLAGSSL